MTAPNFHELTPADLLEPGPGFGPARAVMSTRRGGISQGPWQGLNLGSAVGDAPADVAENRRRFLDWLGRHGAWLPGSGASDALLAGEACGGLWMRQVHGARVLRWGRDATGQPRALGFWAPEAAPAGHVPGLAWQVIDTPADGTRWLPEADACLSTEPGLPCIVQVADCLPLLLAAPDRPAVAAVHAGWRGLAGGVIEAAVAALQVASGVLPSDLQAWIGACIGPQAFEVGAEVLPAFGATPSQPGPGFRPSPRPAADGRPRWLGDLPALARRRLQALGLRQVQTAGVCTHEDAVRCFSFRRDGVTGRMAAAVWWPRQPDHPS